MREQLRAGFVLGALRERLLSGEDSAYYRDVLDGLSAFELRIENPPGAADRDDPVFKVAANLITRGLPTLPSLRVERRLSEVTGLTEERRSLGAISFPLRQGLTGEALHLLHRALVPVDPHLGPKEVVRYRSGQTESEAERRFLRSDVPRHAGRVAPQLFWPQRPLPSLLDGDEDSRFTDQRADFAATLPTAQDYPIGLVAEIDGKQHHHGHHKPAQKHLDSERDRACREAGLEVLRFDAARAGRLSAEEAAPLRQLRGHPYLKAATANYRRPLYENPRGRRWMVAALTPLLIARIQLTLARLAVEDFRELIRYLLQLEGKGRRTPTVEVRVYRTRDFAGLSLDSERVDGFLGEELGAFEADLILDASVLQRPGLSALDGEFIRRVGPAALRCSLRTSYAPISDRKTLGGRPIRYDVPEPTLGREVGYEDAQDNSQLTPLVYFLQNLFRKERFRPHQVDILCHTLRGESVIDLLPTGAGKSLCYQLSALLQPGVACVVAPLKSLTQDQHANLRRIGIEATAFLNSSLPAKPMALVMNEMREGRYQMIFISPERLLIQNFRDCLQDQEAPVTYCVVDEAHCVSEWGHDFRTAYLRLAANAHTYCETAWDELPLIGLTGTASFDVLADVRRELEHSDEEKNGEDRDQEDGKEVEIITPGSFERSELCFEIRSVPRPALEEGADPRDIREAVIEAKKKALVKVLREMPDWFDGSAPGEEDGSESSFFALRGEETNSGLIFTPHANNRFGVRSIAAAVRPCIPALHGVIGCYASSDKESDDDELAETQEAFGMGIDKPNIRYVVHMNMSQSIESYYQEAGRAGRDRDPARCVVLYCDQRPDGPGPADEGEVSLDQEMQVYFHERSFRGQEKEKRILYDLLRGDARPEMEDHPDLEALLEEMEEGEDPRIVTIDFANSALREEITGFLRQHVDRRFNSGIVRRAIKNCRKAEDFPTRLNGTFRDIRGRWPSNYIEGGSRAAGHLKAQFERLRDEEDTFKAVYRLSVIGLVEDYTVDYRSGVIRAHVCKRSVAGYIQHLQDYIARYVAPEQARRVPEEILDHRGETTVQKCLGRLIAFVYETIAKKRRMAIRTMEEAVREGAEHGSEAFVRRVNTYFDSRYLPALQTALPERSFDLELVWDFIDRTGGTDDNVHHLRGACDRLLADHPDSGALHLLRAFAQAMISGASRRAFREDFREGWRLMREVGDLSRRGHLAGLNRFHELATGYDAALAGELEEEIAYAHATWLHSFNEHFLADYHA